MNTWAVPLFKVFTAAFLIALLAPRPPFDDSPLGLAWRVLAMTACVVSLWFPAAGAVLAVPLAVGLPYGSFVGFGLIPMTVLAVVGSYHWPRPAVLMLGVAEAAALVHDLVVIGRPTRTLIALGSLLAAFTVGSWIRRRLERSNLRQLRLVESRRTMLLAREEERGVLAQELAALLTRSLEGIRDSLRQATAAAPAAVPQLLTHAATLSHSALSHLRLLVTTLRAPSTSTGQVEVAAVADWFEDELTSHGLEVEWEGGGAGTATAPDLIRSFLRTATERILQDAPAGSVCGARLDCHSDGLRLGLGYPLRPGALEPIFPMLEERISLLGGSLNVSRGELVHVVLELPQQPTADDAAVSDDTLTRWRQLLSVVGLSGFGIALIYLALALFRADGTWAVTVQWALLFLAAFLSTRRPWVAAALLATVIAASYRWTSEQFWVGTPPVVAMAVATGILACRRPLLSPLLIGAWAAYAVTTPWPGHVTAIDGVLLSGVSIGLGLGARYFLAIRTDQVGELERLAAARLEQQGEVRRHLARELHDLVAHRLSLMALHLPQGPAPAEEQAETIALLSRTADGATHDLASLLATLQGDDALPDEASLSEVVRATSDALAEAGHRVIVTMGDDLDSLDPHSRQTLGRVIREGATNAMRYAPGGSPVQIVVGRLPGSVSVRIVSELPTDARTSPHSTGTGLLGLRERVELTHGLFSAGESGGTWVVRAELATERVGSRWG